MCTIKLGLSLGSVGLSLGEYPDDSLCLRSELEMCDVCSIVQDGEVWDSLSMEREPNKLNGLNGTEGKISRRE